MISFFLITFDSPTKSLVDKIINSKIVHEITSYFRLIQKFYLGFASIEFAAYSMWLPRRSDKPKIVKISGKNA